MANTADDTAAALAQAQQQLEQAQAAHDAAVAETAAPRSPDVIIADLLEAIVMHGGNHPGQRKLLQELQAATKPTE